MDRNGILGTKRDFDTFHAGGVLDPLSRVQRNVRKARERVGAISDNRPNGDRDPDACNTSGAFDHYDICMANRYQSKSVFVLGNAWFQIGRYTMVASRTDLYRIRDAYNAGWQLFSRDRE